jgi:hypothetical protein
MRTPLLSVVLAGLLTASVQAGQESARVADDTALKAALRRGIPNRKARQRREDTPMIKVRQPWETR